MAEGTNEIELLNELNDTKIVPELDDLTKGNPMVPAFLAEWLKNGFDAGAAYRTLRPSVTDNSSRVLGSRLLSKVNKLAVLSAMGFNQTDWFKALQEGLQAVRQNQLTGEIIPDFRVRLEYLKLTGKLLGIIQDKT